MFIVGFCVFGVLPLFVPEVNMAGKMLALPLYTRGQSTTGLGLNVREAQKVGKLKGIGSATQEQFA